MHSLSRSSTRGPEDGSVESKHVAPISHCIFNITIVVFDGPSHLFTVRYVLIISGSQNNSLNFILIRILRIILNVPHYNIGFIKNTRYFILLCVFEDIVSKYDTQCSVKIADYFDSIRGKNSNVLGIIYGKP